MSDGWNEAHSGAAVTVASKKKKHVFSAQAKGCAEVNADRLQDPDTAAKDTWTGGFYMEVLVDGWEAEKTVTVDFHTEDIAIPKHACQNVRVVDFFQQALPNFLHFAPLLPRIQLCRQLLLHRAAPLRTTKLSFLLGP